MHQYYIFGSKECQCHKIDTVDNNTPSISLCLKCMKKEGEGALLFYPDRQWSWVTLLQNHFLKSTHVVNLGVFECGH